jgi:hypothetical protein
VAVALFLVLVLFLFLLLRRFTPAGSVFADGDRAAGVFWVLATGFAVLLGFRSLVTFLEHGVDGPAAFVLGGGG